MTNTIIFDDLDDLDDLSGFGDLNFNLEEESIQAEKATIIKPKPKKKKPEPKNAIGLTQTETETLFTVVVGVLFVTIMDMILIGYTMWYFKQP